MHVLANTRNRCMTKHDSVLTRCDLSFKKLISSFARVLNLKSENLFFKSKSFNPLLLSSLRHLFQVFSSKKSIFIKTGFSSAVVQSFFSGKRFKIFSNFNSCNISFSSCFLEVRTDQFYAKRHYSSRNSLTHVDNQGKASMVDISRKQVTNRHAVAVGCVVLNESAFNAVQNNNISKGDVLTVAKIAGIMGAKRCSDLVPLCHSLSLASVDVQLNLNCDKKAIEIKASVSTADRTGVEMEALTAVSVAALTIYDMCKAIGRDTEIKNIKLEYKSGGNSGEYKAN